MADNTRQQRFEQLYREHFDRVAAYLLARADRDSAADALARTFEIAWRRLDDMPAQAMPWLLGVARRVLADGRRSQRRHDALIERMAGNINETALDHAGMVVDRAHALAAIAGLNANQREALLLVAWDGLTEREAAAVVGCSRGAFALRVHRARKRLRVSLADATDEASKTRLASCETLSGKQIYPSSKEAI
jgi:RNA polymerase sigma factor (sigma-70 family)